MIEAAALLLVGVCAGEAAPNLLRKSLEPRWNVASVTRPIDLAYRPDPDRVVASGARIALPMTASASLFMQARKQKSEVAIGTGEAAAPSQGRAYSVGLSVRW